MKQLGQAPSTFNQSSETARGKGLDLSYAPHMADALKPLLRRKLAGWFRAHARDLPWRRTKDPYAIWLSEVMLQQTRIEQGLPYYERFIRTLPTVQDLAEASEDIVLKLWEGLGYYGRARNLHKAARFIVSERGGVLPTTAAEWQALPGVGPYTAGAVASIAFGEVVPVLDGNVIRVLSRLFDIGVCVDDAAGKRLLRQTARELMPARRPGDFNQALMELGACVCLPDRPACTDCPLAALCQAYRKGVQRQRPVRKSKRAAPRREVVVAAIQRGGRYLVGKRPSQGLLGGLWEFPGGQVRAGESHEHALRRGVQEELGIDVKVGGLLAVVDHAYTHFKVTLNVYACELAAGTPECRNHSELRWIAPEDFHVYAFPGANRKFMSLLK
jgi:A/G-specific adenine glycosylase